MPSKKHCQKIHTIRRAFERYGIALCRKRQRKIVNLIQSNQATHIKKSSNYKSIFDVSLEDITMRVVYDKRRKSIATVLPLKKGKK